MRKEPSASAADPTITTSGLRIYLLGPLRIERAGAALQLSRRKVESLLVYLLLHPQPQTRTHLATLLWGDGGDTQARHSLRTALATLRKEVDPDLLLVDRDQVQRNPAFPLWTDLGALLAWEGQLESANTSLRQSQLALWQGELAAGLYDEWLTSAREHYRARLLKLFLQVTQTLRTRSDYGAAIAVAQQILTVDPANEAAHQHLMFCYVAAGDRPAALRQYEQCERALQADLDVPPMPATTALYQWIKQQAGTEGSTAAKITNLPLPLTSFVGRTDAMTAVKRLLAPAPQAARLLTLSGAGGSGKTRLAIQVATDLLDRFAHGVWWVELGALTDGAQVTIAVARALGINATPNMPVLDAITNFVGDKALLLVIDNCEHLIEGVAHLATALLSRCPNLQLLTTSREALNVTGETLWPVPTLHLPDPQQLQLTELLLQFECVRLFFERATAVQPAFQLTLANAPAVIEICTRLDGIPLAIELAAARVNVLPVETIATRLSSTLGERFTLLTQGSRTALPRQQTLRAAIEWSYDLLDAAERQLFHTVAVFHGGFTLTTLEQIAGVDPVSQLQQAPSLVTAATRTTLDLLTQLVDKSLVLVEQQQGQNRYRLLETLREYALAHLPNAAAWQTIQQRHAQAFLQLAEQAAPALIGAEQSAWLTVLETEHPNLRAALDYLLTIANGELALQLAAALYRFWEFRGYVSEGRAWLSKALAQRTSATDATQAQALNAAGFLAYRQGDFEPARQLLTECLALFEQNAEQVGIATALQNLANVEINQGNYPLAQQYLERSLALSRHRHDDYGIARSLHILGNLAVDHNRYHEACAHYQEALQLYQAIGDQISTATMFFNIGNAMRELGDLATARTNYEASLAISRPLGHKGLTGVALRNLGVVAFDQQAYLDARRYGEAALQILQEVGDKINIGFTLPNLGDVARELGEAKLAYAYYCQALQLLVEVGHKWGIPQTLEYVAGFFVRLGGQAAWAVRLFGAAQQIRAGANLTIRLREQQEYEPQLHALRQQLGEERFNQLWQEGRVMPLAEIVAAAIALPLPDHVT